MSATILHGDCVVMMRELPEASIDAIVTDPPYDLTSVSRNGSSRVAGTGPYGRHTIGTKRGGFMGKEWDGTGVAFKVETWDEAFRVLKPGGHLLAFGGTRTYHRMACAIEDAGFEIRDCLQWLYGSGFPKSLDVSKAIDKAAGAEREVVSSGDPIRRMIPGADQNRTGSWIKDNGREYVPAITAPATPDAEHWQGWGTALKPANEPIVLARKPLSERTVAANVLTHGTGALNIDGCRIGYRGDAPDQDEWNAKGAGGSAGANGYAGQFSGEQKAAYAAGAIPVPSGRWPANVILSHSLFCTDDACDPSCPVALLDAQSGVRKNGGQNRAGARDRATCYSAGMTRPATRYASDTGGASRFYYVAKASRKERHGSKHPTVKPVALMRYLIRLVTPLGGTVLDPFAGSGTTGEAALLEGVDCVLIEREAEYIADIRARLESVAPIETAAD